MDMSPVRSGKTHLARHSKRGQKTRHTEKMHKNNIREWTGLELSKSQRAVENREKWRKFVVHMWYPNDPRG